jgi:hypothetical protein
MVIAAVSGIVCLAASIRAPWMYFTVQANALLALYYGRGAARRRGRSRGP